MLSIAPRGFRGSAPGGTLSISPMWCIRSNTVGAVTSAVPGGASSGASRSTTAVGAAAAADLALPAGARGRPRSRAAAIQPQPTECNHERPTRQPTAAGVHRGAGRVPGTSEHPPRDPIRRGGHAPTPPRARPRQVVRDWRGVVLSYIAASHVGVVRRFRAGARAVARPGPFLRPRASPSGPLQAPQYTAAIWALPCPSSAVIVFRASVSIRFLAPVSDRWRGPPAAGAFHPVSSSYRD